MGPARPLPLTGIRPCGAAHPNGLAFDGKSGGCRFLPLRVNSRTPNRRGAAVRAERQRAATCPLQCRFARLFLLDALNLLPEPGRGLVGCGFAALTGQRGQPLPTGGRILPEIPRLDQANTTGVLTYRPNAGFSRLTISESGGNPSVRGAPACPARFPARRGPAREGRRSGRRSHSPRSGTCREGGPRPE